jgi:polyhydroxyalkanoate synthesis regulator phasin
MCALSIGGPSWAEWNRGYGPDNSIAELEQSIEQFKAAREKALNNPSSIPDYVQAGLTMSNVSCDAWLVSLGRSDRDSGFFKNMLNIVGNLILGISGINGANPSSLARGALALGASNASVDAYRNEFLMGVVSDIETKVKSGRRISEQMLLEAIPSNQQEAKRRLLEYHDQCTPTAIKELLKTSLAQVAYARPDVTLGREINEARAIVLAAQLYAAMYPAGQAPYTITSDDLYKLWVVTIALPADHPSVIVKGYKAAADIVALKATFDARNTAGQLTPLLKQVADYRNYAKRLEDELSKEKQDADGAQEAGSKQRLDAAITDAQRAELKVKEARENIHVLERQLVTAARSPDPKSSQEATALLALIHNSSYAGELQAVDIRNMLGQVPSTMGGGPISPTAMELRDRLSDLAAHLDARILAREREQLARAIWERAMAIRRPAVSVSRTGSITPVIVPVHQ